MPRRLRRMPVRSPRSRQRAPTGRAEQPAGRATRSAAAPGDAISTRAPRAAADGRPREIAQGDGARRPRSRARTRSRAAVPCRRPGRLRLATSPRLRGRRRVQRDAARARPRERAARPGWPPCRRGPRPGAPTGSRKFRETRDRTPWRAGRETRLQARVGRQNSGRRFSRESRRTRRSSPLEYAPAQGSLPAHSSARQAASASCHGGERESERRGTGRCQARRRPAGARASDIRPS